MADTIKEFLVGLGFKIDEQGLKRFSGRIAEASEKAVMLGAAVTAAAVAVQAGVTKIAAQMEALYYASQRTGAAVQSIKGLEYAAAQMGVGADAARGSLEGLANFMRSTPASGQFLKSIGVETREANGQLRDTTAIMSDLGQRLKQMPYYQAKVYAGFLGIDENTLRAMMQGMDGFSATYRQMARTAGVDAEGAAKASRAFMNETRTLGAALGLVWDSVSTALIKKLTPGVTRFRELVMANFGKITETVKKVALAIVNLADAFLTVAMRAIEAFFAGLERLDRATNGWASAVLGIIAAWKLLNLTFLASPIGLVLALGLAIAALYDDYLVWKEGGKSLIDWGNWKDQLRKAIAGTGDFGKKIIRFADIVRTKMEWLWDGLKSGVAQFRIWFGEFIDWFREKWDWLESKVEKVKEFAVEVKETVTRKTEEVSGAVGDFGEKAMNFFQGKGWTKAQAAGIVANLQKESNFNPSAVGDGGKAYGIAQWHPDRQGAFAKWAGKLIQSSTFEEQMAFVHHELTFGAEKAAGAALRIAQNAKEAGALVSRLYERPADKIGEALSRGFSAEGWFKRASLTPSPMAMQNSQALQANRTATITQKTDIHVSGGGDPNGTAQAVAREQGRVNNDLLRNTTGAIR